MPFSQSPLAVGPMAIVAAAALVATAPAALAQTVELRTGVEPDRRLRYDVSQELTVTQRRSDSPDAEPAAYTTETDATLDIAVLRVADGGSARASLDVLSYRARAEDPAGAVSVSFADLDDFENNKAEGPARVAAALAEAEITFAIAADGRVSDIRGLEPVRSAAADLEDTPMALWSMLEPDKLAEVLQTMFWAQGGLGERSRQDEWTTSRRVGLGPAGALDVETTSVLGLIIGGQAMIGSQTEVELMVPNNPTDATPRVTVGETSGNILTRWDTGRGGLKSHQAVTTLDTEWVLGDITINQEQRSNLRITEVPID